MYDSSARDTVNLQAVASIDRVTVNAGAMWGDVESPSRKNGRRKSPILLSKYAVQFEPSLDLPFSLLVEG